MSSQLIEFAHIQSKTGFTLHGRLACNKSVENVCKLNKCFTSIKQTQLKITGEPACRPLLKLESTKASISSFTYKRKVFITLPQVVGQWIQGVRPKVSFLNNGCWNQSQSLFRTKREVHMIIALQRLLLAQLKSVQIFPLCILFFFASLLPLPFMKSEQDSPLFMQPVILSVSTVPGSSSK